MKKPNWWPHRGPLEMRVKLDDTARAFLEASIRADRFRRWRNRALVMGFIVVLVAATAISVGLSLRERAARREAQDSARQAIALHLASDASDLLAQNRSGGDVQAFQELLAAHGLAKDTADGALLDAIINRQTTEKIVDIPGAVDEVVFSPNDDRVATVATSGTDSVWLWETGPGHLQGPLTPHTEDGKGVLLSSIAFSPEGHRLATAGQAPSEPPGAPRNGTVQLWNVDTDQPLGPPLTTIRGADILSVGFSRDGRLAAASSDNTVRFWNPDNGTPLGTTRLSNTGTPVNAVLSPDLHRLATGTDDGAVQLWDADKGNPIGAPLLPGGRDTALGSRALAISADGNRLAASADTTVQVWTLHDGQPTDAPRTIPLQYIESLALSPDGQRLAAGGFDKTVQVWDTGTGQRIGDPLKGHTEHVDSVAFGSRGNHIASGSMDTTLRLWNPDAGQPLSSAGDVSSVAVSPDGHRIAAATDGQVQLWNADTRTPAGDPFTVTALLTGSDVQSLGFSSDGQRLIRAGMNSVWILNLVTGETTRDPLHGQNEQYEWSSVAISADGHRIATGGNVRPRTIPGDAPPALALWNADTGQFIKSWPAASLRDLVMLSHVAFDPDGDLAAADDEGTMRIWDADMKPLTPLLKTNSRSCPSSCGNAMAFSSDGRRLALGGAGPIALWDADTRKVRDLTGHQFWVDSVAFSPTGDRLASGSGDKTLRFWNAKTGQPIGEAFPIGELEGLTFSPDRDDDGKYLITGSTDGVQIWPAVADPNTLCKKITSNMSPQQWNQLVSQDPHIATYTKPCPNLPPN
jgi:WD40 repeat protein